MFNSTAFQLILKPLFLSFALAFLATPLVIKLYRSLGWVEDPQKTQRRKDTHTRPVPRGGGLPILFSFAIISLVLLPLNQALAGLLLGSLLIVAMGTLDDHWDLNPYLRLGGCFVAAGLVVFSGNRIEFLTNPFNGLFYLPFWVSISFSLLWIVFLINALNWVKGFDGQQPGIVVIACLTIALLAWRFLPDGQIVPVVILSAIVAGAYLGFLPFNFYPQKIMPGFGAGALAGFLLASLSILSTTKLGTALVVLGLPIMDAFLVILRRVLSGKSPLWGDREHLHHHILDKWKWSKPKTAFFYWGVTALLGLLALSLNSQEKFYTIIMVALVVGLLFLWFRYFSTWFGQSDPGKPLKT